MNTSGISRNPVMHRFVEFMYASVDRDHCTWPTVGRLARRRRATSDYCNRTLTKQNVVPAASNTMSSFQRRGIARGKMLGHRSAAKNPHATGPASHHLHAFPEKAAVCQDRVRQLSLGCDSNTPATQHQRLDLTRYAYTYPGTVR
jgi:hypothetical protein